MEKENIKKPTQNPSDIEAGREVKEVKKEMENAKAKCEEYLNGWK